MRVHQGTITGGILASLGAERLTDPWEELGSLPSQTTKPFSSINFGSIVQETINSPKKLSCTAFQT